MSTNNPVQNKKKYISGIHQFINVGTGSTSVPINDIVSQNDVHVMTLQNGNVGIGTTMPLQPLHVVGNILTTGILTASNVSVIGDFVTLNTVTSNTEQMVITNDGTGPALKVTQTGAQPVAEFYDQESGLAMTIANNGNIGIGTTTPLKPLHIQGDSIVTGYVGIGTTYADQTLHVVGSSPATAKFLPSNGGVARASTLQMFGTFGNYPPDTDARYASRIFSGFEGSGNATWGSEYLAFGVGNNGSPNDAQIPPSEKMRILNSGSVGIGITSPSATLHLKAGTTTIAPIRIDNGSLLTTPVVGAIEYDGTRFYGTTSATSAPAERGYIPSIQFFRLAGNGSAIGLPIANYFGTTSGVRLGANAVYELEASCYFTKTTSGTVTITLSFSASYNNPTTLNAIVQYGALAGGTATGAANQIAQFRSGLTGAGTDLNFGATGSLIGGVNHAFQIRGIFETGNGYAELTIKFTSSAGNVTPLQGSYYKVTRLPANTGSFV